MKTLDEVIYTMRFQRTDSDTISDAVSYLRDYKDLLIVVHKLKNDFDELTRHYIDENPPLTWDELKEMEGKPVWVEHKLFKGWRLVGWQANEHLMNLVGSYSEQVPLFEDDCGVLWQAYRKEQK